MLFIIILVIIITADIETFQNQYQVHVENFTIDFVDDTVMDINFEIVKINDSNAINGYFKPKINFPENTMISVVGQKLVGKHYSLQVLQVRKPFKEVIEMEQFDLQNLWIQKCRPPMVWPIIKDVEYRMTHWIPNSTNFPANLPGGKWKICITQTGLNKAKQAVANYYVTFDYNRRKSSA